jgi:acetoin utilization deacetylase AcuC-like enzyme
MTLPTGLVRDRRFLDHTMGSYHVENPLRLEAIYQMLDEDRPDNIREILPRPATQEELELIHTAAYVRAIRETAGRPLVVLDPDTSASALTWETARLAAGGTIEAAEAVRQGKVSNAFALVRPPGHHAEAGRARGFCIFNNVALAASHLIQNSGLRRVLVADWDLHHGNGTQHAFYNRRDILYFSTHLYPYYPGTGYWDETGQEEGQGFTINIPLSPGQTGQDYLFIYRNILGPVAAEFQPEFILVSAGFDIFGGDPLGGMDVDLAGFAALAAELLSLAAHCCQGRILFVLEGGYNLVGLREGVRGVIQQMNGTGEPPSVPAEASVSTLKELAPALQHLRKFWKIP